MVATTCLGVGHPAVQGRRFDYCIVDEAGQSLLLAVDRSALTLFDWPVPLLGGWSIPAAVNLALSVVADSSVPSGMVVCPIPLYQHIEGTASPEGYQSRLREWVDSVSGKNSASAEPDGPSKVTLHDPLPDFQVFSKEERRGFRFEHDTHLTIAGHKVLAESLSHYLRSCLGG